MKNLSGILLSALILLPVTSLAEIYKWKDKDGTIRYSDTRPPSNVQQLPVGGKKAPSPNPTNQSDSLVLPPAATVDVKKKPVVTPEAEAIKRQEKAEEDKKKTEQADAELKQKQQNCENAKKNYASYKLGGRMSKIGESGEREYLGDADIATGLQQAQKDVEENCD